MASSREPSLQPQRAAELRAVVRWRFEWGDGYIRGIDLFRVRDGKVAEKLSYVKG